jgi:DamX protein
MSALANTQVNQNKTNDQTDNRVEGDMVDISTRAVSVIARIDYIQRFSKQMTVVVDNNSAVYSKVARQYLANISQESSHQEVNVAFVAASNKINDIQMRCRLIEQLFANTLFDPEQSLAVSILRLAKNNNSIITIIVEHAQALSLQIKYELCQLVDTAKKTQNNINVVIFGSEQAAMEISQNKTIFDKKASIIDASSGQVIALDHARFKSKSAVFNYAIGLKIGLASLLSLLIITAVWYLLSEYESVSFASLPVKAPVISQPIITVEKPITIASKNTLASTSDVHLALIAQENRQDLQLEAAKSDDILQALMSAEAIKSDIQLADITEKPALLPSNKQVKIKQINANDIKSEKLNNSPTLPASLLNEQYYLNSASGYVVQITGFSDLSRLKAFIKSNKDLEYYSYQRILNNQKFFVLTSKVFNDKVQAREAIKQLPETVKNLGSFLKSVSTIKREINTVSQ